MFLQLYHRVSSTVSVVFFPHFLLLAATSIPLPLLSLVHLAVGF